MPGQNGRHFADDIFRCIFVNERFCISIQISLKFDPRGLIDNKPALVQVMAWRRTGDKPLPESVLTPFTDELIIIFCCQYGNNGPPWGLFLSDLVWSGVAHQDLMEKWQDNPKRLLFMKRPYSSYAVSQNGILWPCRLYAKGSVLIIFYEISVRAFVSFCFGSIFSC